MRRDARPYDQAGSYDYPDERDDARLLGVSERGAPVYYDPVAHVKLVGERDPEEALPDWAVRAELPPDVDVAQVVEDVAETAGWDALTDFAHEHLSSGEESETAEN